LQAIRPWDEFNGRIEAVESVQLRSRVSGYIERIAFEGQEVKKGQLLFVIDQRPYRAALASAQAQLERARAAAGLAQTQDQRARQLVAENAVSREEAARGPQRWPRPRPRCVRPRPSWPPRLQLDFTEVRAPITGRASRALLTVGNMAQADQSVLTTLVSQDPVYAYFDADEHSFLRYQKAGLAGLRAGPRGARRPGRRQRLSPCGHAGLQRQPAPAGHGHHAFARAPGQPRPDADAGPVRTRADAKRPGPAGGRAQALLIDDKAVLTDQDRKYVYVVGEGNLAERRDLTLGRMVDGRRLVEKGLAAGDRLVVGGVQRIYYPGMPVNPRPVASATAQPAPRAVRGSAMDFSKFFIDRPIFAVVLSIIMFAVGLVAIPQLPVGEYPRSCRPAWWCAPPIREPIPRRSPSRWPCRWRKPSTASKA
jgi:multidrug efflux system membrane fusion protein